MEIQKYTNTILNCNIKCVLSGSDVWFRGKDIAKALGYENTTQSILNNVENEDKRKLEELDNLQDRLTTYHDKITIYINESGLYNLILKSQKPEAKQFKQWVTSEVLPSIRKTGSYSMALVPQVMIRNETELHYRVIQFIRNYFDSPIIVPGLGELQFTSKIRTDAYKKGFLGGQPDILILNYHQVYKGFAIELKTPTNKGVLSENQKHYLDELKLNGYKTLVSNNYDDILYELMEYFKGVRYCCRYCNNKRKFTSLENRDKHYQYFHKINI